MARETQGFALTGMVAAAALTTRQFYPAKVTAANTVNICTVDGEIFDGVLQDAPASGAAANVMASGITKVVAGEALAAGDMWGVDSTGRAKKVEATVTGADVGDFFGGRVLEAAAAAGELATVTIGLVNGLVEAQ